MLPVSEVEFAPWVVQLKALPWSSDMLLGRREFVFGSGLWRDLDEAFFRVKRFDSRYCCLYDERDVLERSMHCRCVVVV